MNCSILCKIFPLFFYLFFGCKYVLNKSTISVYITKLTNITRIIISHYSQNRHSNRVYEIHHKHIIWRFFIVPVKGYC